MTHQPDLFTYQPRYPAAPAATSDDTSREAAEAMKSRAHGLRDKVLEHVRRSPLTVHECARAMNEPVPTIQPRFSELRAMSLIADSGIRRHNDSGRRAIVWKAAAK